MLPPHNRPLAELAKEEGISEGTLYNWRRAAREQGRLLPGGATGPEGWSAADKFAAVLESAALNEAELGEYCRKRGLYPQQIETWRSACEQANDWAGERARQSQAEQGELRRQVRALQRELQHKEKALAETAALLVLRKKAAAIWGDEDA
jgi:transposase-like protein